MRELLKVFLLRWKKTRTYILATLIKVVLNVLAREIREEKRKKYIGQLDYKRGSKYIHHQIASLNK